MGVLNDEQKKALAPYWNLIALIAAGASGIAINTILGGPRIPFFSPLSAIILGLVGGVVIFLQLTRKR